MVTSGPTKLHLSAVMEFMCHDSNIKVWIKIKNNNLAHDKQLLESYQMK